MISHMEEPDLTGNWQVKPWAATANSKPPQSDNRGIAAGACQSPCGAFYSPRQADVGWDLCTKLADPSSIIRGES